MFYPKPHKSCDASLLIGVIILPSGIGLTDEAKPMVSRRIAGAVNLLSFEFEGFILINCFSIRRWNYSKDLFLVKLLILLNSYRAYVNIFSVASRSIRHPPAFLSSSRQVQRRSGPKTFGVLLFPPCLFRQYLIQSMMRL